MTSQRPYLLRALYEWVVDNGMTPHLLVDARMPGVRVPRHAVEDGRVVLNIAERAVARLDMGADAIRFTARFGGVSQAVVVPLPAVIALYARETGQGMALPPEETGEHGPLQVDEDEAIEAGIDTDPPDDDGRPPEPPRRGGHLRIVK